MIIMGFTSDFKNRIRKKNIPGILLVSKTIIDNVIKICCGSIKTLNQTNKRNSVTIALCCLVVIFRQTFMLVVTL